MIENIGANARLPIPGNRPQHFPDVLKSAMLLRQFTESFDNGLKEMPTVEFFKALRQGVPEDSPAGSVLAAIVDPESKIPSIHQLLEHRRLSMTELAALLNKLSQAIDKSYQHFNRGETILEQRINVIPWVKALSVLHISPRLAENESNWDGPPLQDIRLHTTRLSDIGAAMAFIRWVQHVAIPQIRFRCNLAPKTRDVGGGIVRDPRPAIWKVIEDGISRAALGLFATAVCSMGGRVSRSHRVI